MGWKPPQTNPTTENRDGFQFLVLTTVDLDEDQSLGVSRCRVGSSGHFSEGRLCRFISSAERGSEMPYGINPRRFDYDTNTLAKNSFLLS